MIRNRVWLILPFARHGVRSMFFSNFKATYGAFGFASYAHKKSECDQEIENVSTHETLKLSAFIDELLMQPSLSSSKEIDRDNYYRELMKAQNYWSSFKSYDKLSSTTVTRFSKDLEKMNINSLVFLLIYFGNKRIRYGQILEPLCKRIEEFIPLNNPVYVTHILKALPKLDWADANLITKLKHEVSKFRNNPDLLKSALFSLARLHLTDRNFWRQIIESLEPILETKQISDLCLLNIAQAFALANVDCNLIAPVGKALIKRLCKEKIPLSDWLEFAYVLTCFNCLDTSIAESVLNKNFVDKIYANEQESKFKSYNNEKSIVYDNMRLKTISCAAKLELPNYKGTFFINSNLTPKLLHYVLRSKFNDDELPLLSNFELLMRLIIPLNSYSTGREWHEKTGVIIEGRCFVNISKREFVPLNKIENKNYKEEAYKEVAILFFTKRQVTRIFDQINELGPIRLVGICQTGIRLLKKSGLHPVVFTDDQFQTFSDERTKMEFIRNKLLNFSDDFHENNWVLDETKEINNKEKINHFYDR